MQCYYSRRVQKYELEQLCVWQTSGLNFLALENLWSTRELLNLTEEQPSLIFPDFIMDHEAVFLVYFSVVRLSCQQRRYFLYSKH